MAKDFHHGLKTNKFVPKRKNTNPDWETSKIRKTPSKKSREDALRHALTHGDVEALEDYDEPDFE